MSFVRPLCLLAPPTPMYQGPGHPVLGIPSGAVARAMMPRHFVSGHPGHGAEIRSHLKWLQLPSLPGTARIVLKDYQQEWSEA